MYKIDQTSWHFRLWRYLLDKSLVPFWFTNDRWTREPNSWKLRTDNARGIPDDLCSYINRILMYFFLQVPSMITIGAIAAFLLVLTPIIGWIYILTGVSEGPDAWFVPIGTVLSTAYLLGGLYLLHTHLKDNTRFYENAADKLSMSYETRYAIKGKINKITSPLQIFWDYVKSVSNKVCLRLTFDDPLPEVSRGYGHRDVYPAE